MRGLVSWLTFGGVRYTGRKKQFSFGETFGFRLSPKNRAFIQDIMRLHELDSPGRAINFIIASWAAIYWLKRQEAKNELLMLINTYGFTVEEFLE